MVPRFTRGILQFSLATYLVIGLYRFGTILRIVLFCAEVTPALMLSCLFAPLLFFIFRWFMPVCP